MTRYVSFSGGADSTALAILLADRGEEFTLLFADTGAELPETYYIAHRVARDLAKPLVVVSGPTFYERLIARGFYLPSARSRWCTRELKTDPLNAWLKAHGGGTLSVGICADEAHRMPGADRPLVEAGIGKAEARKLVHERGLLNPCYDWRSSCSCFCCPFQRPWDWRHLWSGHPHLFALAEDWEVWSLQNAPTKRGKWNEGFTLRHLREAEEAQVEMFPEPREEACAICAW